MSSSSGSRLLPRDRDDSEFSSPLLDPVTEAILSSDYQQQQMHDDFLSHSSDYLSQLLHSITQGKDPSEVLAGTHSYRSLRSLPAQTRSRLVMNSSFSQRFSFASPNNSARLSTFLLLNSMIGSGILNQPFVFRESGIVGGIVGFIFATVAVWTGLLCLTGAGLYEDVHEYSALAHRAFSRAGERVVDVAIVVLTFGSQLGYILVVGGTLSSLLQGWGCERDVCTHEIYVTVLAVVLFVTPICLFRHFGHLAYLSLFSVLTIFAVIGLVLVGGPIKHQTNRDAYSESYRLFDSYGMFMSLGSIVFSLDCASSNFQAFISTESQSQNLQTWRTVTRNAVFSGAMMCMFIGLVGYLSFSDETEGEILDNFPQAGFDVFKVLVVIHLILYIPTNFVIMRYSVVKLCLQERSEMLPVSSHIAWTVSLLAVTLLTVIALLRCGLSNGAAFSLILNITGGIGGSLEAFILPAAIYLKLMPDDAPLLTPAKLLFAVGCAIMIAVVTTTVLSFL